MATKLFRVNFNDGDFYQSALIECAEPVAESVARVFGAVNGTVQVPGAKNPHEYQVDHDSAVSAILSSPECQYDEGYVRNRLAACDNSLSFAVAMCNAKAFMGEAMYARLLAEQLGEADNFVCEQRDALRWSDGSKLSLACRWMSKATDDTYDSLPCVNDMVGSQR